MECVCTILSGIVIVMNITDFGDLAYTFHYSCFNHEVLYLHTSEPRTTLAPLTMISIPCGGLYLS